MRRVSRFSTVDAAPTQNHKRRRALAPAAGVVLEPIESRLLMAAGVPKFDHVVVVLEENHAYNQIIGASTGATYINQLASGGALMTNSHGVSHPSEPNYIALFSGSTQGVTDDNVHMFTAPNLGGQLKAAGLSFVGYAEAAKVNKHDPWESFTDTVSMAKDFSQFPSDFTQLPTVSFVVPNQINDMHDGTIQQGDAWLKSKMDAYAQWAKTHNSLLIVTFDEDTPHTALNQIPTIFYGAGVKTVQDGTNISHYNILRTLQDMYGLPSIANSTTAAPITTIWSTAPTATAPAAPTTLLAIAASTSQIDLAWKDASTDETGFAIERSTDGTNFTQVGTVAANVNGYSDKGLSAGTTYTYRVDAFNTAGKSGYSNAISATTSVPAPTIPAAPTALGATSASTSSIQLSWTDNSTDEKGFAVERSADGTTFAQIGTVAAGVKTYSDTGLVAATTFSYRVTAFNDAGKSAYTNVASAKTQTPAPTIPAAPTTLGATAASTSSIQLSWTDNSSDEKGFAVERSPDGTNFTQIGTVAAGVKTYSDTGLAAATTFSYRVMAFNDAGKSAYTNVASAKTQVPAPTIPAAPSALGAAAMSTSSIHLTWADNSTNENGFAVERSSDGTNFTKITSVLSNQTEYMDTGLAAGTTFSYRVMAYNDAGMSGASNVVAVKTQTALTIPAAPSALQATADSPSSIKLSWTDNSSNESGFVIERSTDGKTFAAIAPVTSNGQSFSDTGLSESTTYTYRVMALNDAGKSAYSNTSAATTPAIAKVPASPSALQATADSASSIQLSWTDNAADETGSSIERSTDGKNFALIATVGANVHDYSDTGLSDSTTYTYRVQAVNAVGPSAYSNTSAATTAAILTAPATPADLQAVATSTTAVKLTWTDASTNESGFAIERAAAGADFAQVGTIAAGMTSFNDSGLSEATSYSYRVMSYNAAGKSGYSNTATAATMASPKTPAAPSGLGATAASSSAIDLKWADNSDNESGFVVQRSTDGTVFTDVGRTAAGVTTFHNTGLRAATAYTYRVCAFNDAGSSDASATASAKTAPGKVHGHPHKPRGTQSSVQSLSTALAGSFSWPRYRFMGFGIDQTKLGATRSTCGADDLTVA